MVQQRQSRQLGAINSFAIVVVLIVVAVTGIIFIFSTRTQLQPKPPAQTAANLSDVQPQATSAVTKWTHYSNPQYHFGFTYPSDWKVTEGIVGENRYLITLTDLTQLTNTSILVTLKASVSQLEGQFVASPGITVLSRSDSTVAGHEARTIRYKSPDGVVGRFYLVGANDNVYKLATIYESGDPKPNWYMQTDISQTLFSSYNFDIK
jgi:hypothetical protein